MGERRVFGENDVHLGFLHHQHQALGREVAVERHIGAACFHDSHGVDGHQFRTLYHYAYSLLVFDAEAYQLACYAVGDFVNLLVGVAAVFINHI